ncbi:MAG: flagellar assembly protein FliW [Candidatus Omnitrophota bacterium]
MNAMQTGQDAAYKLLTTRFGEIEVRPSDIVTLPEGLLGFNLFRRYIVLEDPEQAPFLWLQSVDEPDLAFVIVDPFLFFPGYEVQVKPQELSSVQVEDIAKAKILTIVTIPPNPMELTANLRGPLVFNVEAKLAKQLVLIDDRYNTKHSLLKDIPPYLASPPEKKSGEKINRNHGNEKNDRSTSDEHSPKEAGIAGD